MASLTPAGVRKQIKTVQPDPIYLLQGEDEVEKTGLSHEFEELVEEGLRAFNIERIHAGDATTGDRIAATVGSIAAAVRTLPMMSPRRVVIVLQAESLLAPKRESESAERAFATLQDLLQSPYPQITLVLVATPLDKRSRAYKLLVKQATIVECGVIEDRAGAEQWIRSRVSAAGVQIEPAAARLLAERAGFPDRQDQGRGDIGRLRGEVDRLLIYALGQKTITAADAREVAGPAALRDDWAITNAIEAGDAAKALREVALVLDAGAAPEKVLGQIGWSVRARLRLPPPRLTASVDAVFRADLELKTSSRSGDQARIILERLVVELCGRM